MADIFFNNREYKLNKDAVVDGFQGFMGSGFFLVDKPMGVIFSLQEAGEEALPNRVFIEDHTDTRDWENLVRLLGFADDYSAAVYSVKISQDSSTFKHSVFRNPLLAALGFSGHRLEDAQYVSRLTGLKKRVFMEKKIPPRVLKLTESSNQPLTDTLFDLMLSANLNGNLFREILGLWIDLDIDVQNTLVESIRKYLQNIHPDGRARAGDEIKNITLRLRYPGFEARQDALDEIESSFLGQLKITHDKTLENIGFKICREIREAGDIDKFISEIQDSANRKLCLRILEILA